MYFLYVLSGLHRVLFLQTRALNGAVPKQYFAGLSFVSLRKTYAYKCVGHNFSSCKNNYAKERKAKKCQWIS